ncbi:superoxide dismutase family protein [Thiobacillus sp.]|uniref:superoxide dismutase family protein n=1 Tax=Thiobacillus sp. TaxID=924 RepID=UPI0025E52B66|nr:superoxide dismutase family protein [Thiobacillus sp.]
MQSVSRIRCGALPRILAAAGLLFCAGAAPVAAHDHMMSSTAVLVATSGSSVSGSLTFREPKNRVVHISGTVEGLTPGKHGFHIHVNGNCDSPDGMSAGGHYAPAGGRHGAPGSKDRHLGDLGNIEADASGRAVVDVTAYGISIALMGAASVDSRSIVIHAREDDFSDPAGNSGARVACGVIESDMMPM